MRNAARVLLGLAMAAAIGLSAWTMAEERRHADCLKDVRYLLDAPQTMAPMYMSLIRADCP